LPSIYDFAKIPKCDPKFFINYEKAYIYQNRKAKPYISVKMPQAGSILRFYLLGYEDEHKTELLGRWMI